MYAAGNKKMLNMLILEILKNYSDEEHRLTQQEIIRILERDYSMECDRKTVKRNIDLLDQMGYEINMENGYYLEEREFEEAELRMLIDSVLFSKNISGTMAKRLIQKLESFGNKYFRSKISHVVAASNLSRTENKQVLYTVQAINDAIDRKKKVKFRYKRYGIDKKLHDQGRDFVMSPYQMVATNGRYYLLGNHDKYDDVSYYRIDKISDVEILDEKAKPMKQVKGLEKGLDIPRHMAEHVYMFHGESGTVKLKCHERMMDNLIDWFGKDIWVSKEDPDSDMIMARLTCNYESMRYWALQYGPDVEVVEPLDLRADIREIINDMAEKYKEN